MADIYTLNKLDSIEAEAIRGSTAQKGIYVTPNLIRRFNGDGNTAIIFKRLLYCCEQWADEEGWFYQTAETVEQVVGLGYRALQRSVKRLEKMGLIEKKLAGMPYKTYYRVNLSAYLDLIKQESSLVTSDKASSHTSAETSPDIRDETCPDTSSEQVILSDSSNDTKSDTNLTNAIFPEKQEATDDGADIVTNTGGCDVVVCGSDADDHHGHSGEDEADPLLMPFERRTAVARAAGGDYAAPSFAGGSDAAAGAALVAMYQAIGSEPSAVGTNSRKVEIEKVGQVLRDYRIADLVIAGEAGKAFGQANRESPHFVNPRLSSFPSSFGIFVGKANKAAADATARRDGIVAANEEAVAARPKPQRVETVEGDPAWEAAKRELALQMTRQTFEQWVAGTYGLGRKDGVYTVAVPDEGGRDWLRSRLKATAERTLVGILGEAVEVRFEVAT